MGTETSGAVARPASPPERPDRIENRVAAFVLALVPAGLVLYLGFNGGGFFPGTVGLVCMIMIQLLIVRVLLADHPFEGFSRGALLVGVPLAGFVVWILLSALWSDAHDRALIEFDRGLLYLLVFLLFAVTARTASRMPWVVRGLTLAITIVAGVGLFSRLRPDVIHTTADLAINRLAYPLTYWNALGILSAIGILLLLGLSASRTQPRILRAIAAAAVPVLALTVYFTFSRGSILALAVGLVVFVFLARSPGLVGTLLAVVPTTLYALVEGYAQEELASNTPRTALAVSQGDHLLHVVIGCVVVGFAIRLVAAQLIDRRLYAIEITPRRRRAGWLMTGGVVLAALLIAVVLGAPGWVSDQYDHFLHGTPKSQTGDLRVRFTDPSNNGRIEHWRAATQEFSAEPLHGSGAGTYEYAWNRRRRIGARVVDAHSVYVEVMAEYGIVGLVLLVAALVGIVVMLARRLGGRNRTLYAAVLAAVVTWALHAGVDWDWEMPAVTAWVFAVGGAASAARVSRESRRGMTAQRSRVPVATGLLVAAVTPVLLLFSQGDLTASARAFALGHGNCVRASRYAIDAIDDLALRPQPYRILGYCDIRRGHPAEAIAAMRRAVDRGPEDWESHYGLALALAADGRDPRPSIARALALNPREPAVKNAVAAFRKHSTPRGWSRAVPQLMQTGLESGALSFR
jgi:O-antigen ligase